MDELVKMDIDLDIETTDSGECERRPGFGWTMSEAARASLREIEANIRAAEQISGTLIVG